MQYLVEWASGAFQVVTGEQLAKDIDEYWKAPNQIYRLTKGQKPKRYHAIIMKDYWYLIDDLGNHLMIL